MYETIMELPLFKGIGEEQLSQMLEKTSVEFIKYEDGDFIARVKDKVETVTFILSGRVRRTHYLENFKIGIDEILGKGNLLGALHLFGLVTNYGADIHALGKVSVMKIRKSDYMNILLSDRIYLLNFVNYLSAAAQKTPLLMQELKNPCISRSLYTLAFTYASRGAETIMVAGEDSELARFCGVSDKEFEEWKSNELSHNRIIVNQRGIFLKSPHLLR